MRVNIFGTWYDAKQQPIQIELTESDKKNIANMHEDKFNYICYPDELGWDKAKEILKIED
jgi:hypothetical protein